MATTQQSGSTAASAPTPPTHRLHRVRLRRLAASGYLGEQRCDHCNRFCRVAGLGGRRPGCDEPVLLTELLGELAEAQQ